jgi:hypothetical protein
MHNPQVRHSTQIRTIPVVRSFPHDTQLGQPKVRETVFHMDWPRARTVRIGDLERGGFLSRKGTPDSPVGRFPTVESELSDPYP